MNLSNKVVFISGASGGIGAMAARQFAAAGARVVLGARTVSKLENLAREIKLLGGKATTVELDVTDDRSVQNAVAAVLAEFGGIDVLINNAGNGGTLHDFLETSIENSRAMFDVHVFGTERMTRAVLPSMMERKRGRIVMVLSTVAYVPMPGAIAYCSAKASVLAMAEALRGEFEQSGVEIACFSPPHTQTDSGKDWPLGLPRDFSPEFAAGCMVESVRKDRMDYVGGGNGSLLFLQRMMPKLARKIMNGIGVAATAKAKAIRARTAV